MKGKPKPPAIPPSSPEMARPEMNGKDGMVDGHPVIGNGSIDPHQNIEDHPKLTQADTVTGLTLYHSCFSHLLLVLCQPLYCLFAIILAYQTQRLLCHHWHLFIVHLSKLWLIGCYSPFFKFCLLNYTIMMRNVISGE